jgi:curved DNA-binding protein
MKNPYDILGVSKSSSTEEIKRAYRKLAQKWHPDKPTGDSEKFKELNDAYKKIISGEAGQPQPGFTHGHRRGPFDDLHEFMRRTGNGHFSWDPEPPPRPRNPDVNVRVECKLSDTFEEFTVHVNFRKPNDNRVHSKRVTWPKGAYHGMKIKYGGEGGILMKDADPGDLYMELVVVTNEYWTTNWQSLTAEGTVQISVKKAMLGGHEEIIDPSGEHISVTIPAGTQHGTKLRLKEKGLLKFRSAVRGPAILNVQVVIPSIDDMNKRVVDLPD